VSKKISVIMTSFNDEKNIENAIESILEQTYKDFEFLILDDFSTDQTYKKFQQYSDESKIKIFQNKENLGLTKSLNILIKKAEGKYIFRQDSDDISFPKRFEKQINILEKTNFKVCTTRAINKTNNKKIPGLSSWIPKTISMRYKNPFIHGTLAIERALLISLGYYDEEYYYSQDFKLFTDLYKNNEKIYEIKEPLYLLNTKNNISSEHKDRQKFYFDQALNSSIKKQK
jgi:Glycosyltransferases involved in cell wall biogenesis|tara:strand:+ start:2351 stop:3037 length:687 start_codon:yes stop_codon:yes gene_type:complete